MNFKFRAMDADAQGPQNPIYHTQPSSSSSIHSYFTGQPIRAGFPSGTFGGDYVGPEMFRGCLETREAIQRQVEKERIREEMIAEEMEHKRILEAEVRNELMMERQMMAMRSDGGFSSPFMPRSLPPSHNNLFEPRILHRQPIGLEERIIMSLDEKYLRGGHDREIRAFEVVPLQRFDDAPKIRGIPTPLHEDRKKEVILGKPNGETLSGTKRKPTPPVPEGSVASKKKVNDEWSCAICQVSVTSERGLTEHLQGKKHLTKEAALIAQKTGANFGLGVAPKKSVVKLIKPTSTTANLTVDPTPSTTLDSNHTNKQPKSDKFKFWCEMCLVGAFSEKVMNNHKRGKKHLTHLVELLQKGKMVPEKTCNNDEKTKTETKNVVVEVVGAEGKSVQEVDNLVKTVKDETGVSI